MELEGSGVPLMRAVCVVVALAVTVPVFADWSNCNTVITAIADLSKISAITRCTWTSGGVKDTSIWLEGSMTVTPGNAKSFCAGGGYCGMSVSPEYVANTLYTSNATIKASSPFGIPLDSISLSDTEVTPLPVNPHTTCPDFTTSCNPSPILISLRGDYHLTSVNDGVRFDLNADGTAEQVSWAAAGAELAFLALDRNGNGRIDSGAELFGDAVAENGWIALAALDENGDNVLNAIDAGWRELLLWYDTNHDGASAHNELVPVRQTALTAISTRYRWTGRRDAFGNTFRYAADVTLSNGRREAYDVYFVAAYE